MSDYDSRDNESPDYLAGYAQGQVDALRPYDRRGDAPLIPLNREEQGIVVDALIEHIDSAAKRKAVNPESTSDVRITMCRDIIRLMHAELAAVGVPEAVAQDNETEPRATTAWCGCTELHEGPVKVAVRRERPVREQEQP
jgi:hypothetical protein